LTLWFNHGAAAEVERALEEGFQHVSIDTWLVVIPQIIARIHSPSAPVRNLIHSLLIRIGRHHPQVDVSPPPNRAVVCFGEVISSLTSSEMR
jgi:FKBP12-rapamycin complex-associated protein